MECEARYHPSGDQLALASALDESLTSLLPLSRLHAAQEETAEIWASLHELGVFGIGLSEERGGSGLGTVEEALIVTGLGRRLIAPAVLATIGATHVMPDQSADVLGRTRRATPAYRHNDRIVVVQDATADLLLMRDGANAALFETGPYESKVIDDRNWSAGLREGAMPNKLIARLELSQLLRLRLIDAAALAGIAEAAVEMSVAYAGFREQFGRPIGSFQAVKHHCANMAIAARCARDQTNFAAVAIDDGRADAGLQVECALFVAGSAARENAGKNIQIHGGMGFSDEADPHLLLKRAQLLIAIAGGLEAANARIADMKSAW